MSSNATVTATPQSAAVTSTPTNVRVTRSKRKEFKLPLVYRAKPKKAKFSMQRYNKNRPDRVRRKCVFPGYRCFSEE